MGINVFDTPQVLAFREEKLEALKLQAVIAAKQQEEEEQELRAAEERERKRRDHQHKQVWLAFVFKVQLSISEPPLLPYGGDVFLLPDLQAIHCTLKSSYKNLPITAVHTLYLSTNMVIKLFPMVAIVKIEV